jgi:predicted MPP superfamily phosphohydrolase
MIKRLEFNSPKIKVERKFLLISDIHKHKHRKKDNLEILKRDIQKEFKDIDYILITGDIIDSPKHLVDEEFLKEFKNSLKDFIEEKETFIVLGNHDVVTSSLMDEYLYNILNEMDNIKCLNNKDIIDLGDVIIQGFTPDILYYKKYHGNKYEFERQFIEEKPSKFNKNKYNILMTHDPSSIIELSHRNNKLPKEIDLVVTGHMHNGLVPRKLQNIMKNRGLVGPYRKLLPKYAYGDIEVDNTKFIILGAVNPTINIPTYNKMYGYDATILTLKKDKH